VPSHQFLFWYEEQLVREQAVLLPQTCSKLIHTLDAHAFSMLIPLNTLRTGHIVLCFSLLNVADWSHNIIILGYVMLPTHYTLLWRHAA
jgi:hypothetical protein